jgi:tetratricopeptide (TPR) repeat protein
MIRGVLAISALALLSKPAGAQPCLISGPPGTVTLQSSAGVIQPRLAEITPSRSLTVVLAPGFIAPEDRDRAASELAGLHRAAGRSPLRLFAFNGSEFVEQAAAASPAAWRKAVQQALAAGELVSSKDPTGFYAAFGAAAGLGGDWSSVLLVGAPPETSPDFRDYTLPWLAHRFCDQKLRVSYWNPDVGTKELWNGIAAATAGASRLEKPAEFPQWALTGPVYEASWPGLPLPTGYLVENGKLNGASIVIIRTAGNVRPPTPAQYAGLRRNAREAIEAARLAADSAGSDRARQLVQNVLAVNPLDSETLTAGAAFYARLGDYATAARLLGPLAQARPADATLQGTLGDILFRNGDFAGAEPALLAARDAKAAGPAAAEELARIRIARGDYGTALPLLEEALQAAPGRADLWFLKADASARASDWSKTAEALEKGLAIAEGEWDRRTELVNLYVAQGAKARALPHVRHAVSRLPDSAAARRQYAGFVETLELRDDAAALWRKAIEADPRVEEAHVRLTRLLSSSGNASGAIEASEAGLAAAPASAPLHLARADALEKSGRFYAARDALRVAARSVRDPALLERLATMEDVSGSAGAPAYAAAFAAANSQNFSLAERGLEVAMRDGDSRAADQFRQILVTSGKQSVTAWLIAKSRNPEPAAVVPGGLSALAFMAHARRASPQQFFSEYCRTVAARAGSINPLSAATYQENLAGYFQAVSSLKALGVPSGRQFQLVISVASKTAVERSERILGVLGLKLRHHNKGFELDLGEKASNARRQDIATALSIDVIGMQEAVRSAREFRFEIEDGEAPVILGAERWLETFFPKEKLAGGFAEALVRDPRLARTYAGLSAMDRRAADFLTSGSDLKTLAEKHSDLIYRAGSGLALKGSSAAVPGGPEAEGVWTKLAGAAPSNPGRFFLALMEKHDGKALAFYTLLGQLDVEHQRFFTRSAARAEAFYELFRDSRDMARGADRLSSTSSFVEFLREIPLDDRLQVLFPGGPEVWMVAKGKSSTTSEALKRAAKLSRVTAPEQEDKILIRLAETRYRGLREKLTECDNFVAVVRIERHRSEPLESNSALMLAENYATAGDAYPYFSTLTELSAKHFEQFFRLADQVRALSWENANPILGQLHSLIELLCLARETGALSGQSAAELFGLICERFTKAATPADRALACLELARALVTRIAPAEPDNADEAIEAMLFGGLGEARWVHNGETRLVNTAALRKAAYRKTLSAQKVPSLSALIEADRLLRAVVEGKGDAGGSLKALETVFSTLPAVSIDKNAKMDGLDRQILEEFQNPRLSQLLLRLKQRAARKKVNPEDLAKLRMEILAALSPQIRVALCGIVYAHFLAPEDLIVSEDPLLLRKHRFLDSRTPLRMFAASLFQASGEGAGSHFLGGFAQFYDAAGYSVSGGGQDAAGSAMAAAQIGGLRATRWGLLAEDDIRRFGLRIRLAREWILRSAANDELLDALVEESNGVLSPTRRTQLIESISIRDWESAMGSVTAGDLYTLSVRYLRRFRTDPWQSPVTAALRVTAPEPEDRRLQALGGSAADLLGCNHSHLAATGPYEQYEGLLLPAKLAERAAEFKLSLADAAGRLGIPPAVMGLVAEPLAVQALTRTKMSDTYDWASIVAAWRGIDEAALQSALAAIQ